jgi:hypothetical protein
MPAYLIEISAHWTIEIQFFSIYVLCTSLFLLFLRWLMRIRTQHSSHILNLFIFTFFPTSTNIQRKQHSLFEWKPLLTWFFKTFTHTCAPSYIELKTYLSSLEFNIWSSLLIALVWHKQNLKSWKWERQV